MKTNCGFIAREVNLHCRNVHNISSDVGTTRMLFVRSSRLPKHKVNEDMLHICYALDYICSFQNDSIENYS